MAKKGKKNSAQKPQKQAAPKAVTTKAVAAVGTKVRGAGTPSMTTSASSLRIRHMEYVGDIDVVATASATGYVINPQRAGVFTWLSQVATRFEMFRFHKLRFHYKPSVSTSANGFVILAFDFDSYDAAPSKVSALAWKYATKSALWQEMSLDVTADSRMSTFRYNNYAYEGDRRLDSLGVLWVLSQGELAGGLSAGELFVEYDCEMRQPAYKLPPVIFSTITNVAGRNVSTAGYFPDLTPVVNAIGNLAFRRISNNTIQILDPGQWLVSLRNVTLGGGNFATAGSLTVTNPAGSPSSQGTYTTKANDVTQSLLATTVSGLLDIVVPPINLTVASPTGSTNWGYELQFATLSPNP